MEELSALPYLDAVVCEVLQKEVARNMAPNAFAAAIAEFNKRHGNFDDE